MSKYKLPFTATIATNGISATSVQNAMSASQEAAPYLYTPQMSAFQTQDQLHAKVVGKLGETLPLGILRLAWDLGFQVVSESVAAGVKVDAGAFFAEAAVAGTVSSSNAQPTAANELYANLTPKKAFRDATAKIPYADSASDTAFSVLTITEPRASGKASDPGCVTAGKGAYLHGSDMTSDLAVHFVNKETGEKAAAAVTRCMSTVAVLTVPETLAAGVYALEVRCTGRGTRPVTIVPLKNVRVEK